MSFSSSTSRSEHGPRIRDEIRFSKHDAKMPLGARNVRRSLLVGEIPYQDMIESEPRFPLGTIPPDLIDRLIVYTLTCEFGLFTYAKDGRFTVRYLRAI